MSLRYRCVTHRYATESAPGTKRWLAREWRHGMPLPVGAGAEWRPNADVYATASDLVVQAELAGMREEDIEVTVFADVLLIAGQREASRRTYLAQHFYEATVPGGRFRIEIPLPFPIDSDRVTAHYDRGFLEVVLPKAAA